MRTPVILIILLLSSMTSGSWARAEMFDTCNILARLARFPVELAKVHSGNQSSEKLLLHVNQVDRAIGAGVITKLFSPADLKHIKNYTSATRRHLMDAGVLTSDNGKITPPKQMTAINAQIIEFIGQLGCLKSTNQSIEPGVATVEGTDPGLSFIRQVVSNNSSKNSKDQVLNIGRGKLLLLFAIVVIVVLLPAYTRQRTVSRELEKETGCKTRALLTFGNNCTVTTVSSISHNHVKLHAPRVDISEAKLDLYLAGHRIAVTHGWANDYYIGLDFVNPLSDQILEDIVETSQKKDQLSQIGKNATDCYFPGCHLDCKKHRVTQLAVKYSNQPHL